MKKRGLFVFNAPGGGATQGIKEYLEYQNFEDIEPFIVLPSEPNEVQKKWLKEYTMGYFVVSLPWWNIPYQLPILYRWLLFGWNLIKSQFRYKAKKKLVEIIKEYKIDFIYTNSILIKEACLAANAMKIPHYWHIKETFGSKGRVKFLKSDKMLEKFILMHSTKVICMTEYIRSFFKHNQSNSKIIIIPDGINPDMFVQEPKLDIRKDLNIKADAIVIGMVASFSSVWKNHKVFLESIKHLSDLSNVTFVAFGPEPQKYNNEVYNLGHEYYLGLKRLSTDLGISEKIIWGGFYNDIPSIFKCIDIFVHPCATEPFGRVVIEAMAAGKSIVVPDQGGSCEPITNMENGLLYKSNNSVDLSEKIRVLLLNTNFRIEIGGNARKHVIESKYNLKYNRTEMQKLFNQ